MRMNAIVMSFGLLALAMGCGNTPPEESSSQSPPQLQASPAQDRPSERELAATAPSAPVTAVPVRYVVDPSTTTQVSVSAGAETANPSLSAEPLPPGAMRRVLE